MSFTNRNSSAFTAFKTQNQIINLSLQEYILKSATQFVHEKQIHPSSVKSIVNSTLQILDSKSIATVKQLQSTILSNAHTGIPLAFEKHLEKDLRNANLGADSPNNNRHSMFISANRSISSPNLFSNPTPISPPTAASSPTSQLVPSLSNFLQVCATKLVTEKKLPISASLIVSNTTQCLAVASITNIEQLKEQFRLQKYHNLKIPLALIPYIQKELAVSFPSIRSNTRNSIVPTISNIWTNQTVKNIIQEDLFHSKNQFEAPIAQGQMSTPSSPRVADIKIAAPTEENLRLMTPYSNLLSARSSVVSPVTVAPAILENNNVYEPGNFLEAFVGQLIHTNTHIVYLNQLPSNLELIMFEPEGTVAACEIVNKNEWDENSDICKTLYGMYGKLSLKLFSSNLNFVINFGSSANMRTIKHSFKTADSLTVHIISVEILQNSGKPSRVLAKQLL